MACTDNYTNEGHAWIIDGLVLKSSYFVTEKHFEYTDNWMNESEYYESFDDLKNKCNINSEYDIIYEETSPSTEEYLRMNWGYNGNGDKSIFGTYPNDSWTHNNDVYKYSKQILYDFR